MRGIRSGGPHQIHARTQRIALMARNVGEQLLPPPAPIRLPDFWSRAATLARTDVLCGALLCVGIALYTVAYSSLSIATYRAGRSLFDLAAFEQSFWNAAHGRLFLTSLEVTRPDVVAEMCHFGRHFSPIFVLLLPIYMLHQDATTLLVVQSLALGSAALPLYLFGRARLKSNAAALVIALLYLANPAIHDVNTVNEFHELAFVVPLIFLAFYALETERTLLYGLAVAGMLFVKEDVALTVCALGIYVALCTGRRRLGVVTFVAGATWFIGVVLLVIPAFRGPNGPIPYLGYDYLGTGVAGIIRGMVLRPLSLWHVVTAAAKLRYIFWLLMPVSFVVVLAPEVLFVALPALVIILASTFPLTYALFAHYVAPIVPVIFIALVISIGRLQCFGWSARRDRMLSSIYAVTVLLVLIGGTAYAQVRLRKLPTDVVARIDPDPRAAAGIALVDAIPERASLVVEDHRWLAHAANRRLLYFLFGRSPQADYVVINPSTYPPITNVHQEDRQAAVQRIVMSGDYLQFQCSQGFSLYIRKSAYARDEPALACTLIPSRAEPS